MNRIKYLHLLLSTVSLIFILTGCELNRSDESSDGDIKDDNTLAIVAPLAPNASAEEKAPFGQESASNEAILRENFQSGTVDIFDIAIAAGHVLVPAADSQPTAILSVEPAGQTMNAADTTTAEIKIKNVSSLAAVDLELNFDPAVLQVVDADSAKEGFQIFSGDFLSADFVVINSADNSSGVVRYTVTQVAPTPPASGEGVIALIQFKAIAPGNSPLTFLTALLASGNAQPISANTQPGEITVVSGGTVASATPVTSLPTATHTPVPGSTPINAPPTQTPPIDSTQAVADTPTPVPPTATPTFTPVPTPIVLAQSVYIPPQSTFGFCYRAQHGEDIYVLSQKYNTSPDAINLANDLNPPYFVKAQQTLFIPQEIGSGPNVYRVKFGDTLAIIAERCKLPVSMLARVNNLDENHPLYVLAGTTVVINGKSIYFDQETLLVNNLVIPIPPFPPPSRYQYPRGPIPFVPFQEPYPIHKDPLAR